MKLKLKSVEYDRRFTKGTLTTSTCFAYKLCYHERHVLRVEFIITAGSSASNILFRIFQLLLENLL